ncbi:MAG: tRNA uridine-5-carboxymethylaminomethyl(34) synthesis GTPase MnmE [Deltaproteobacteria bacterium]|nr:MAG: tRNA uridine-5-carboxymethylaminomethyl(34) synthesis GTPase MnmE [Deltaproteobacteria bacterium]
MRLLNLEDTIAAIATPPGTGSIGIIRVSGPRSRDIASLIFRPSNKTEGFNSHRLYHGDIISPDTGRVIDEVLISFMMKPHSYTGEDILEINCHGSAFILQSVLSLVIKAGARLAEPGEFTKRAFLNNRIDLSQAEAVAETIMAQTDRALDLAVSHLKGDLAGKIETVRRAIIDILAILETSIDFSDEDVEVGNPPSAARDIEAIIGDLTELASTYGEGKIYRDGINAVIAGRPNVGKSSLLNRLLGEKRAIVTAMPGTTRDFIEEIIPIKGVPVRLTDTAGIREPQNIIEKEGVNLVWEKLSQADVVIVVIDGSERLTREDIEIIEKCKAKKFFLVINKADLPHVIDKKELASLAPDVMPPIWISAKHGEGIPALKDAIHSLALNGADCGHTLTIVSNIRHKMAIEKTRDLLSKARDGILQGLSPEFPAFDIRQALESLGEIAGETVTEEVLDRIFATFCIGK